MNCEYLTYLSLEIASPFSRWGDRAGELPNELAWGDQKLGKRDEKWGGSEP